MTSRGSNRLTFRTAQTKGPGVHADGLGLYLAVSPSGARSWVFRFTVPDATKARGTRTREMGLGRFPDVGVAEARGLAEACRGRRREGIDPIEAKAAAIVEAAKQATRKVETFRSAAEAYLEVHEGEWKNKKHRQQWANTLATYAFPHMGDVPVAEVSTSHIVDALTPIWRNKTETATRVRERIEAVLDYAKSLEWRVGENPARWRGHLANRFPKPSKVTAVEHHAALPWREVGTFIVALRGRESVSARALEFVILTAARTGEVLGARWCEIDMEDAVWIVPAGRMKAGREHRVPLSDPALAVLHEMERLRPADDREGGAFVFPGQRGGRPLSGMSLLMLLRRMKRGDLTAHGFRSTFRDWAAEETNYPNHVMEMALAHKIDNAVEASYRRGDLLEKRTLLMGEWASYCGKSAVKGGNIVRLRKKS